MKITNMKFTTVETAVLYTRAGMVLQEQGVNRKEAMALIKKLTPQNVLRLALGFERRQRGGARPNTGRRNAKKAATVKSIKP